MKRRYISFPMVIAVALLFAVSEVRAELSTPVAPQRTCSTSCTSTVAGPCLSGIACEDNLAKDFPRIVNCPAECDGAIDSETGQPLSGQFLRWDYLITPTAKCSPSLIGVQVSAGIAIEASVGGGIGSVSTVNQTPSLPGIGSSELAVGQDDWDSVWLKFPGNATATNPYLAAYFTQLGVRVSQEGVSTKSGNTILSCGVAGAGASSCVNPNSALYTDLIFEMPGPCTVTYQVTPPPDCKAVSNSMQVLEGECTVTQTDVFNINGQGVLDIGTACPVVTFTTPGSCRYCVPITGGGVTCTTCYKCCVSAATGKCVKTSTLTNPLTQCKSGTYTP